MTKGDLNDPLELLEEVRLWVRRAFREFEAMCRAVKADGLQTDDQIIRFLREHCSYLSGLQRELIFAHLRAIQPELSHPNFLFPLFDRTPEPCLPVTLRIASVQPAPAVTLYQPPRPDW